KALDLLPKPQREFIRKLSEIRNHFVHHISNVSVNLRDYLNEHGRLEPATKAFCFGIDKVEYDDRKLSNIEYIKEDPKYVIWIGGVLCLGIAYVKRIQA